MGTPIFGGVELAIDIYQQDSALGALDLYSCSATTRKIRGGENASHISARPCSELIGRVDEAHLGTYRGAIGRWFQLITGGICLYHVVPAPTCGPDFDLELVRTRIEPGLRGAAIALCTSQPFGEAARLI
jgi:hypothetical protein